MRPCGNIVERHGKCNQGEVVLVCTNRPMEGVIGPNFPKGSPRPLEKLEFLFPVPTLQGYMPTSKPKAPKAGFIAQMMVGKPGDKPVKTV